MPSRQHHGHKLMLTPCSQWLALCLFAAAATTGQAREVSSESVKERINALYLNMDVPEIAPSASGTGGGLLNVSLKIGSVLKFSDQVLDVSFTLNLRWFHKFLEVLKFEYVEAVPLDRQKLWTPQLAFLNVLSVTEDQSSLYLNLLNGDLRAKAVVYSLWYRASLRCDQPSVQYPFGDRLCSLIFLETHPENQRSLRMSLSREQASNCTRLDDGGHSLVYRVFKALDSAGKPQFRAHLCLRSSIDEMTPVLRQHCTCLAMVLLALSTLFCYDRVTRLFANLGALHVLVLTARSQASPVPRPTAADIWQVGSCLTIGCCLLVNALSANGSSRGGGDSRVGGRSRSRSHREAREASCEGRGRSRGGCNGHHATIAYQKECRTSKCVVSAAGLVLSDSSDHLDLFDGCDINGGVGKGVGGGSSSGGVGGGGRDSRAGFFRASHCRRFLRMALPLAWAAFASIFWAALLLTAPRCETLLSECFVHSVE